MNSHDNATIILAITSSSLNLKRHQSYASDFGWMLVLWDLASMSNDLQMPNPVNVLLVDEATTETLGLERLATMRIIANEAMPLPLIIISGNPESLITKALLETPPVLFEHGPLLLSSFGWAVRRILLEANPLGAEFGPL